MNQDRIVCGWLLRTSFSLPELMPWSGTDRVPDVIFSRCESDGRERTDWAAISLLMRRYHDGRWGLRLPSIGEFVVRGDSYVDLIPETNVASEQLSTLALGPALALLCHQRKLLALRATAVGHNGCAMLLLGAPGVGKSTTAYQLLQKGFQLISDGIAVIAYGKEHEVTKALSTSPALCLWRSAVETLGRPCGAVTPIRPNLEKYSVLSQPHRFDPFAALPIRHAIWLVRRSVQSRDFATIPDPAVYLERLKMHLYFRQLFQGAAASHLSSLLQRLVMTSKAHVVCLQDPVDAASQVEELLSHEEIQGADTR